MNRWLTYVKERFPLPVYVALAGGLAVSGQVLGGGRPSARGGALAFVGLLLFFGELRLMDEYKDRDKDALAHPERPLPRGLLGAGEARRAIHAGVVAMLAYSAVVGALAGAPAGALYATVTAYLWLMFKELYAGAWLGDRPLLYAFTHQIVLVPLVAFAVTAARPEMLWARVTYLFGASVLGAFFTYEVARKLDPRAHPVLKTYLSVYGPRRTIAILVVTSAVALVADVALRVGLLLGPAIALVVASLPLLVARPSAFRAVEALATLSLTLHLWGPALQRLLGWPS